MSFEQANLSNIKAKVNSDVSNCWYRLRKTTPTYRIYLVNIVILKRLPFHWLNYTCIILAIIKIKNWNCLFLFILMLCSNCWSRLKKRYNNKMCSILFDFGLANLTLFTKKAFHLECFRSVKFSLREDFVAKLIFHSCF